MFSWSQFAIVLLIKHCECFCVEKKLHQIANKAHDFRHEREVCPSTRLGIMEIYNNIYQKLQTCIKTFVYGKFQISHHQRSFRRNNYGKGHDKAVKTGESIKENWNGSDIHRHDMRITLPVVPTNGTLWGSEEEAVQRSPWAAVSTTSLLRGTLPGEPWSPFPLFLLASLIGQ